MSIRYRKNTAIFLISCCLLVACSGKKSEIQPQADVAVATFPTISEQPSDPASSAPLTDALQAAAKTAPNIATVTISQSQQFSVTAPAGVSVTWNVDGVAGGNGTIGKISTNGLYSPPAAAGIHTITATNAADKSLVGQGAVAVTDLKGVYTYHNDSARTGQNLQEYALTPATVSSGKFGKRWSCALDGEVYAQPLYVANLKIGGATHNIVILATVHDSVYAIDADDSGCITYWQASFLGTGITPFPIADAQCSAVLTDVGILSTPVIDPSTNILYLVAATKENDSYVQRIHALNLADGSERAGSPVDIHASISNASGNVISFAPIRQMQRGALALTGTGIFVTWASYCDAGDYWGWVMRYDKTSLAQTAVLNVAPNGTSAGIWMAGGAPAIDSSGNLFLNTGNGSFNNTNSLVPPMAPNNNFGESFLKLDPTQLSVKDFYTPSLASLWTSEDEDISSSGITLLPDGVGGSDHPNLLVGADKQAHIWLIDRANMAQFHSSSDPVVQYTKLPGCVTPSACVFSTQAYWNGNVYVAVNGGTLMALPLVRGVFPIDSSNVVVPKSQSKEAYGHPSPVPMVSASPAGNAIVWVLDNSLNGTFGSPGYGNAILRAYDANDLSSTLFSSSTLAADDGGRAVKFTLPVVANGHVYVGGGSQLTVYGVAP